MQVQERVVSNDGHDYRGVTSTTQTTSDPVTGAATRRSSTLGVVGQTSGRSNRRAGRGHRLHLPRLRFHLPCGRGRQRRLRSLHLHDRRGPGRPVRGHLQDHLHHPGDADRLGGRPGGRRLRDRRHHRRQGGVDEHRSACEAVRLIPAPPMRPRLGSRSVPGVAEGKRILSNHERNPNSHHNSHHKKELPMRPMILFLALIAVLFLLGFAVHTLVWVALVALVVWLVVLMVRPHVAAAAGTACKQVRRLTAPRSAARRGADDPRNHPNRGVGGRS